MIQLTDKGHWAVEVPDDWQEVELHFQPSVHDLLADKNGCSELIMWYTAMACGSPRRKFTTKLPEPGTWQFLFTTKEVTEDQARKVVPFFLLKEQQIFDDYTKENLWFYTANDSLESLLRSKGLDVNKNYAILLKQNENG